jgi:hypothetical protein
MIFSEITSSFALVHSFIALHVSYAEVSMVGTLMIAGVGVELFISWIPGVYGAGLLWEVFRAAKVYSFWPLKKDEGSFTVEFLA